MACWPASSAATSGNTMAATTSSSSARSRDRKSTRLNSSHQIISYAVFCLKKEKHTSELQSPDHLLCRLLLEKNKLPSSTRGASPSWCPTSCSNPSRPLLHSPSSLSSHHSS